MTVGPVGRALAESLRAVERRPQDAGARALARRLAQLLDDARGRPGEAEVYNDLGPKYLAVLTALGLTPQASGGGVASAQRSKLDELRARRDARARQG